MDDTLFTAPMSYVSWNQNERWIKYELLMWVEKLTIIIWFWIPSIDVKCYIGFLYANMKILIYILNFKHSDFSVAMLLNIISPKWLHRWRSNSQRLNIPLGNRYICLLQNNDTFIFMFILKVCCLGTLGEPNILRQLAHTILTEMKTVKIKIIIVRL